MLQDICYRFEQTLEKSSRQCESMLTDLDEFESKVILLPIEMVGRRLLVIAYWITSSVQALEEKHGGKGYACVIITKDGQLVPYWFENKLTVADKKWWESQGLTVLSVQEAHSIIKGLIGKLTSGMWVDVVSWISRSGF